MYILVGFILLVAVLIIILVVDYYRIKQDEKELIELIDGGFKKIEDYYKEKIGAKTSKNETYKMS